MTETVKNNQSRVPRRVLTSLLGSLSAGVVPRMGAPYIAIGRGEEIASLLGETTAETKVALLKLKKTLADGKMDINEDGRPTDWKTARKV